MASMLEELWSPYLYLDINSMVVLSVQLIVKGQCLHSKAMSDAKLPKFEMCFGFRV